MKSMGLKNISPSTEMETSIVHDPKKQDCINDLKNPLSTTHATSLQTLHTLITTGSTILTKSDFTQLGFTQLTPLSRDDGWRFSFERAALSFLFCVKGLKIPPATKTPGTINISDFSHWYNNLNGWLRFKLLKEGIIPYLLNTHVDQVSQDFLELFRNDSGIKENICNAAIENRINLATEAKKLLEPNNALRHILDYDRSTEEVVPSNQTKSSKKIIKAFGLTTDWKSLLASKQELPADTILLPPSSKELKEIIIPNLIRNRVEYIAPLLLNFFRQQKIKQLITKEILKKEVQLSDPTKLIANSLLADVINFSPKRNELKELGYTKSCKSLMKAFSIKFFATPSKSPSAAAATAAVQDDDHTQSTSSSDENSSRSSL